MNKLFSKIKHFIFKYAKRSIAFILCLTIFSVLGITKLEVGMENEGRKYE